MHGIDIKVSCKTHDVLTKLRENMARHSAIVSEARAGYVARAKAAILAKLAHIEAGRVVDLRFSLIPPKDYSSEYQTVIAALEMHQGESIELSTSEVRMLIQDEWDWARDFLLSNSVYSAQSQTLAEEKGFA